MAELIPPLFIFHSQIRYNGYENKVVVFILRKFDYLKLMDLYLPVSVYQMIAGIHEYRGNRNYR